MEVREIRFRFVRPAGPLLAVAPWFKRASDGVVHGTQLHFAEGATEATLVGFASDFAALAADFAAAPTQMTLRRDGPHVRDGFFTARVAWRDPVPGGGPSPLRLAHDLLGEAARPSFSIRARSIVQRIMLPDDVAPEPLWAPLAQGLQEYARMMGADLRCELERVAVRPLRPDPNDPQFLEVVQVAFDLGALDTPPIATCDQVAAFLAVPPKAVETYLEEARSSRGSPPDDVIQP